MRDIRGNRIGMIFQEPMTSLNPSYKVGFQIAEVLRKHRGMSRQRAPRCSSFSASSASARPNGAGQYPHELSGGLRQRVVIAMAIACGPALLIADEPTTALDVTVQAQILELIRRLQREIGMSVLLITHDLGIVAETCERPGDVCGAHCRASERRRSTATRHPYTKGLLSSSPRLGHSARCWQRSPAWCRLPASAARAATSPLAARAPWTSASPRSAPRAGGARPRRGLLEPGVMTELLLIELAKHFRARRQERNPCR